MLGPEATWDDQTELLAGAVDWLGHIDYLLRRAYFKGNSQPPRLIPRPGDPDEEDDGDKWAPSSPQEALALLRADYDLTE